MEPGSISLKEGRGEVLRKVWNFEPSMFNRFLWLNSIFVRATKGHQIYRCCDKRSNYSSLTWMILQMFSFPGPALFFHHHRFCQVKTKISHDRDFSSKKQGHVWSHSNSIMFVIKKNSCTVTQKLTRCQWRERGRGCLSLWRLRCQRWCAHLTKSFWFFSTQAKYNEIRWKTGNFLGSKPRKTSYYDFHFSLPFQIRAGR